MGAVNASRADVARLLGRVAFGATKVDLDTWTGKPYVDLVDSLFPPFSADRRPPAADDAKRLSFETNDKADFNSARALIMWWMERMRSTAWPLEERLTYFWHDHWGTGIAGPPNISHAMKQNQTLRVHALGNFRAMCNAMTTDGAMLYWLSGYRNAVNSVNENYAREFFELFTNGVVPQVYTETDVRQAAKAFTGWGVDANLRAGKFTQTRHDRSVKTILGVNVGGYPLDDARNEAEHTEVTNIALGTVTAAKFVAYKLVINFGYVPSTRNTLADPDPLIDKIAASLVATNWDLKAAVRTMLLADEFRHAPAALRGQNVRAPIEVIVHLAKLLGQSLDYSYQKFNSSNNSVQTITVYDFLNATTRAGQALFFPPGVEGWPNGVEWLTQSFNLGRYEMPVKVFYWWKQQNANTRVGLPPSGDLAAWTAFMGLDGISANTDAAVRGYLAAPGSPADEMSKQQVVLTLLSNSPEWQVM